jgi:hypothetical protein
MTRLRASHVAFLVSLLTATLNCGSSPRQLVSMNLTPATADAHSYPNGQVQFTATGTYNHAPLTGSVQPALWSIYKPQATATINQNGVAQCGSDVGNFSVLAYAIADPSISQTQQNLLHAKKVVLGTAVLICP